MVTAELESIQYLDVGERAPGTSASSIFYHRKLTKEFDQFVVGLVYPRIVDRD